MDKNEMMGELFENDLEAVAGGANIGFLNGFFDACDDQIFGTCKGAKKSGPLYAAGYSIAYGVNKLSKKVYCGK